MMNRKLTAFLLVWVLLVSLTLSAGALVLKDEVVYARLSPDGKPGVLYVVNGFEADVATEVTDYGSYSKVFPLAPSDSFHYGEDSAKFSMPAGRFYYQGALDQGVLPWTIELAYTLNAQPVTPDALSGAQGHLEMTLRVTPVEEMRKYADSLALQITFSLDREKCFNITADRATAAIAGNKQTLSYIILPGQSAEYVLGADVENFSMEDTQAAGVRMVFDTQMYQEMFKKSMAGSPFEAVIGDVIGNFMKNMQGGQIISFTDSRNEVASLQFVMLIQGIPEKEAEVLQTEEPPAENVWDRLLHLIGL